MARANPQVEALRREADILRRMLAERSRDPGDLPVRGCGDGSCIVARPTGMHTNGGCRCELREVRRAQQGDEVMNWSNEAEVALYEALDDYTNRISMQLESERRAMLVSAIAALIDARVAKALAAIRSGESPDAD